MWCVAWAEGGRKCGGTVACWRTRPWWFDRAMGMPLGFYWELRLRGMCSAMYSEDKGTHSIFFIYFHGGHQNGLFLDGACYEFSLGYEEVNGLCWEAERVQTVCYCLSVLTILCR